MSETYLHRTDDDSVLSGVFSRAAAPLSYHFGFTAVILVSYFMVWRFAAPTSWLAQAFFAEDHLGEWLQFACCLGTCFVALKTFRVTSKKWLSACLFFGGIAMFFIGGEEISWGQRLLSFKSEYFYLHNYQGETNLHNMLPLESNILPYYAAAIVIGLILNVIGLKLTPAGDKWPFADTFFSALVMGGFYICLPMANHIYFYEYSELWIYASILIFTVRIRKNILQEMSRGVL